MAAYRGWLLDRGLDRESSSVRPVSGHKVISDTEISKRAGEAFVAVLDSETALTEVADLRAELRRQAIALGQGS